MRFVRGLHTSRVVRGFRRSTDGSSGAAIPSTPRKASGEFRWFEKAAPYGRLNKNAPQIPTDSISVPVGTADTLPQLRSADLVMWPGEVQAQLHHLGSFKPDQQHELFKEYVSLIRGETRKLWDKFLAPGKSVVLTGDGGVGKSSLLAQAHAAAKLQHWGVIHITRASDLLDGSTDAIFNEKTKLWEQPMYMARLGKKTLKGNRDLELNKDVKNVRTLQDLLRAFGEQKVLVTVDNLNAISQQVYAKNTDRDNNPIYHADLEVVNTLLSWIQSPPANVTVMGATCAALKPIDWQGYAYAPLTDFDPALVAKLKGAEIATVGHLSGPETAAFVKYLNAVDITNKSWEELYQYGNGNPRTVLTEATNFSY